MLGTLMIYIYIFINGLKIRKIRKIRNITDLKQKYVSLNNLCIFDIKKTLKVSISFSLSIYIYI